MRFFSGPPACSLCIRVTLLVDQNILERRNIRCTGGGGGTLWNEAGVRGFTVLITCNFEPERVDSSAYSNVRAVAKGKSLASTKPSSDRLTNGTGHSH